MVALNIEEVASKSYESEFDADDDEGACGCEAENFWAEFVGETEDDCDEEDIGDKGHDWEVIERGQSEYETRGMLMSWRSPGM